MRFDLAAFFAAPDRTSFLQKQQSMLPEFRSEASAIP